MALVLSIIVLLIYFFWPIPFKISKEDNNFIRIYKDIEGTHCYYDLNEQEINDFIKILEKSKFRHGVFRPDDMIGDKLISVNVHAGSNPMIEIYYNNNRVYVYAIIPNFLNLNNYYRISNKDEIRSYIEKIINSKTSEFEKPPSS